MSSDERSDADVQIVSLIMNTPSNEPPSLCRLRECLCLEGRRCYDGLSWNSSGNLHGDVKSMNNKWQMLAPLPVVRSLWFAGLSQRFGLEVVMEVCPRFDLF